MLRGLGVALVSGSVLARGGLFEPGLGCVSRRHRSRGVGRCAESGRDGAVRAFAAEALGGLDTDVGAFLDGAGR